MTANPYLPPAYAARITLDVVHDHTDPVIGCRCAERARLAQGMTPAEEEQAATFLGGLLADQRRTWDKRHGDTPPRRATPAALIRRPSRVAQLERLLARYRWANAGLRTRVREAELRHDQTLDQLTALVDEQARVIGHAHPAIVGARAIIGEARVR